ncbi:MAG TPA: inositol monophosphatase family protein, partial [Candidatus Goldiibacteriota bacterium]|nr:inositol monophosphatase family protein [Candidatus Goldiibacteriota bacterium]
RRVGVNPKGDVTKYFDSRINGLIIGKLRKKTPVNLRIVSEELSENPLITVRKCAPYYSIIIDPVDGSDNYMAKTPFVAMALAVFDDKLRPVCSFAGNYYTSDTMYADTKAVYFNGNRIKRPFRKPAKDLLLLSVSVTRPKYPKKFISVINEFDIVRSFGATAGEMLYVVKGEASAFVDMRGKLTLENFAPFFLAAKHLGLELTDEKGRAIELRSLSLTKGYKLVFAAPAALKKITRHSARL